MTTRSESDRGYPWRGDHLATYTRTRAELAQVSRLVAFNSLPVEDLNRRLLGGQRIA